MKKSLDLMQYKIDPEGVESDLYGKRGAIQELAANKTDLVISGSKIAGMFVLPFIPPPIIAMIGFLIALASDVTRKELIETVVILAVFSAVMSGVGAFFLFFDTNKGKKTSLFQHSLDRFLDLWDARKALKRFIDVEAEHFEDSQARDVAPILLARIKRHNKMLTDGARLIALQETLDANACDKKAPDLQRTIFTKAEKAHEDLTGRLRTYEVMKDMRGGISSEITTSLLDIQDFDKDDLDQLLQEKERDISLLLDTTNEHLPGA